MEIFTQKEIVSQVQNTLIDCIIYQNCVIACFSYAEQVYICTSSHWTEIWDYVPFVHFFANVFCNFKFCITQIKKWTCQLLSVLQFASIGSKPLQLQLLFGPYRSSMECFNFCYFVKLKNRQKMFIFKWCI